MAPAVTRVRRKVRKPAPSQHRKRSRHGKRKARALMVFVAVWVGLVALMAAILKQKGGDTTPPAPEYVDKSGAPPEEDLMLLNKNFESSASHLQEFINASDAPTRSLHVLRSEKTVSRMVRYYAAYPAMEDPGDLGLDFNQVIHTPAGPAIEAVWTWGENQKIDTVFFQEGDEWKLDWDAFVRFNTEPWSLFLAAQGGPTEGVFRVLARERIGATGKNDEYIALVLGVPRSGYPGELSLPSPEIRVKRASEAGRRIEEAFKAREQGLGTYGSKAVQNDPSGMIRLRVRIAREGEAERTYRITELLGTHWLELDEPPIKTEE